MSATTASSRHGDTLPEQAFIMTNVDGFGSNTITNWLYLLLLVVAGATFIVQLVQAFRREERRRLRLVLYDAYLDPTGSDQLTASPTIVEIINFGLRPARIQSAALTSSLIPAAGSATSRHAVPPIVARATIDLSV